MSSSSFSGCQFRVSTDHRDLALYCNAPCVERSSYCDAHYGHVYTREKSSLAGTTDLASWSRGPRIAVAHEEDGSE